MYSVSEEFSNQIKADNREFSVALTFNSSTELTGTTIQKMQLDEVVNSTDVLTFGCACSNKITVNLIDAPRDIDYKNSFFTARQGLKLGEMPTRYEDVYLGKFYVTDVQTTNDFKNVTVTAYDGFCKMTGVYVPKNKNITTLNALYLDLQEQLAEEYGIILKQKALPYFTIETPYIENITYTQAIAYIAGCLGGFARFDRYGELEIAEYTETNVIIAREEQYMNGFKKLTDTELTVTSVSTGTKDNPIVKGDGAGGISINFENPYITDDMADAIYAKYNNFTYTPCQLKWRGNPAIQAGDIVHATDSDGKAHNILVMSQRVVIGSGLQSTIDCKGKNETTSKFSSNFETSSQKLDRIYKTLEAQIKKATEAITGNDGGYVVFNTDEVTGHITEILVMDQEDKAVARNVWRWNKDGFGHSSQGYNGPFTTAITADGTINADFIATGSLSSKLIKIGDEDFGDYINIEDGVIHFGEAENPMSLKLGKIKANAEDTEGTYQLAFYSGDKRIAYFSNNSFEIENLLDGKIRFQNFGFIPRQNGNLTFTKLT